MEILREGKKDNNSLSLGDENNVLHKSQRLNSNDIPKIVPLYDGQELNINQELIMNGLATISIRNLKHQDGPLKKRNSFFSLHRPELKGLNIVPGENQPERMLQQHILKEVKTIHDIRSMKSLRCNDGLRKTQPRHSGNCENKQEIDMKSSAALLMEKRFLKKLSTFDQEEKLADISDTESQESITETVNAGGLDNEIKSTVIE